ncbi:hypothetical protein BDC45DRAFT_495507 [Circinella umbellata]|nr:hypothetical protein BDC45DRAFT_495507 [Circinella umbellata]
MEMLVVDLPVNIQDRSLKNKAIFIQDIFRIFTENIYADTVDVTESEACWNDGVMWPLMKACSRYIRLNKGTKVSFIPGEAPLKAMTNIGAATSTAPYLADGILRVADVDDAEICLLETSNTFDEAKKAKVSFDHHKAMFALLLMVRNTAQEYQYAGYEDIKEMKFYFIHAHGNTIRVWSMSTPEEDVYIMTKEIRMPAPNKFSKKAEQLFDFLEGSWKLMLMLNQSIDALLKIREAHEDGLQRVRKKEKVTPLPHVVNPVIQKNGGEKTGFLAMGGG